MFPPATYIFVQGMNAETAPFSTIWRNLERLGLDPEKIKIKNGRLIDVFHPTAEYTLIERFGSSSEHFPEVFFVDGLNVAGSRQGSFGNVDFSVQICYYLTNKDIIEDHGSWEARVPPELNKLEAYLSGRKFHPYRSVREVRR